MFYNYLWKQVEQYINRILLEEDVKNPEERNEDLFYASAENGNKFYEKGDFAASRISSLEAFLLTKVMQGKLLSVSTLADLTKHLSFPGRFVSRHIRTQS